MESDRHFLGMIIIWVQEFYALSVLTNSALGVCMTRWMIDLGILILEHLNPLIHPRFVACDLLHPIYMGTEKLSRS